MRSTISSVFSVEMDGDSATRDTVADCSGGAGATGATGANGATEASWSEMAVGDSDAIEVSDNIGDSNADGMGEGTSCVGVVSLVKGENATLAFSVVVPAALML
jgi:hypothetical protein